MIKRLLSCCARWRVARRCFGSRAASLQRSIVAAYLLMALGGCLFFFLLAVAAVEGIEEYLVDERLENVALWALPRHAAGLPVDMPAGLAFYRGEEIPHLLKNLPQGVHEVFVNGNELHVLTGRDARGTYVVVDHDSEYDKIEWVVYTVVGVGLFGFLILSLLIGRYVARRVVTPVTRLAAAVRQGDALAELPVLDGADEIGDLARAFSERTSALQWFLDRERFFTGDVSHELRTPLTVIIGAAEIIRESVPEQPVPRAAAERILRTAAAAAESVTVLLLLARAPEQIDAPATAIGKVAQEAATHCQHLIAGKPVALLCQVEKDFVVHARSELLAAVIGNLLRNACQYTASGSVRVCVHSPTVVIEDTGPGISPSTRARLLNMTPAAEMKGSAGTGIGLALVVRICEYLGVHLDVETHAKGGSKFTLRFMVH